MIKKIEQTLNNAIACPVISALTIKHAFNNTCCHFTRDYLLYATFLSFMSIYLFIKAIKG